MKYTDYRQNTNTEDYLKETFCFKQQKNKF